jgi:hypothetical protein
VRMTTISLKLPASLAARLEDQARADQKPKSALVREFIERGLRGNSRREPSFHDLAKSKCGLGRSGLRDLATNPKHLGDYGQ